MPTLVENLVGEENEFSSDIRDYDHSDDLQRMHTDNDFAWNPNGSYFLFIQAELADLTAKVWLFRLLPSSPLKSMSPVLDIVNIPDELLLDYMHLILEVENNMSMNEQKHYIPEHPLPTEIQNMSTDDTICKYCGVSYLIHNEIKRLEEKVEEYRIEVERLQHHDDRERKLQEEIHLLNLKSSDLLEKQKLQKYECDSHSDMLNEKSLLVDKIMKEKDKISLENSEMKQRNVQYIESMKLCQSSLYTLTQFFRNANNGIKMLSDAYKSFLKQFIVDVKDKLKEQLSKIIQDRNNKFIEVENRLKNVTSSYETTITDLQLKHDNEMKQKLMAVEKDKQRQLQLHIDDKNKLNISYSQETKKLEDLIKDLESAMLSQKNELKILKGNSDKLIKNLETENIKIKSNAKLIQLNEDNDRKTLMTQILKFEEEKETLINEREKMITAHQHRIEELRESYKEKLNEAKQWPSKLDEELLKQKYKFELEKEHFKKEILLKCEQISLQKDREKEKEINECRENCELKEKKLNTLLRDVQTKLAAEMKVLQDQLYTEKKENENETCKLKDIVYSLQKKLEEEKEKVNNLSNTDPILEKENTLLKQSLQESINEINEKEVLQSQLQDEIQMLRDCVRRECEERYELTESLSRARTELLTLQRFESSKTKAGILPTPPPASILHDRKSASSSGSDEINQHKHTGRSNSLNRPHGNNKELQTSNRSEKEQWFDRAVGKYSHNKLKISLKNHNR